MYSCFFIIIYYYYLIWRFQQKKNKKIKKSVATIYIDLLAECLLNCMLKSKLLNWLLSEAYFTLQNLFVVTCLLFILNFVTEMVPFMIDIAAQPYLGMSEKGMPSYWLSNLLIIISLFVTKYQHFKYKQYLRQESAHNQFRLRSTLFNDYDLYSSETWIIH